MARVAVVGSYGVGLTFAADRFPEAGETVSGRVFRTDHGGKGSNQAIGAARLGAEASLLTAVGTDPFGIAARRLWEREGVAAAVVEVEGPTMAGAILVDAAGQNRIVIVPGALTGLAPAHVDEFADRIAAADVLLVQLEIPIATARHALAVGRDHGVRTILNPAPAPAEPLPRALLELADHVTPNESEAATLDLSACRSLVLTRGAQGAEVAGTLVPAFPAEVVDTTGAGDAFNSAFAVALAGGLSELDAARWGNAAGAHMVEHEAVLPGLPTRPELEARLLEQTAPVH